LFNQANGVLQKHAQTLRDQREPNIDDLLMIVTESASIRRALTLLKRLLS
jgi:exodeoxyribonuclease VII small subunit